QVCRMEAGRFSVFGPELGVPPQRWDSIVTGAAGDVWIRSSSRLLVLPKGGTRFISCDTGLPKAGAFGSMYVSKQGQLFVATHRGLASRRGDRWEFVDTAHGLATDAVSCVLEDREGSIWLGLRGSGIARWIGNQEWEGWTRAEGLSSDVIWSIGRDPAGVLWIGTDQGVNRMLESATDPSNRWRAWTTREGLGGDRARTVAFAPDGCVWIGSYPGGVSRIYQRTGKVAHYGAESGLSGDRVLHLMMSRQKRLWVSTWTGLFRSGPLGGKVHFERVLPPDTDGNEIFFQTLEDHLVRIWVAGSRGLACLENGNWRRYTVQDGLRSNYVGYLAETSDALWVGYRESVGLSRLAFAGNRFSITQFSRRKGLRSDQAIFVGVDRKGRVWYGSDNGVDVLEGGKWRHYGRHQGLIWDDWGGGAFFGDADGGVWIGTSRGLSRFRPAAQVASIPPPPVAILSILLGREPVQDPSAGVRTGYKNSSLRITMAALSYLDENATVFRYRLLGLDGKWQRPNPSTVQFDPLAPGAHTF